MVYYVNNDEFLAHHGILGQKWGVRRYQNEDGSLTEEGRKRYNKDSDLAAISMAKKYEALVNFHDKKKAATKLLGSNPKAFNKSRIREEYIQAVTDAEIAFKRAEITMKPIYEKYKDVKVDVLTENKTGEQYVRSFLKSKKGDIYESEFYLGTKIEGYDKKK